MDYIPLLAQAASSTKSIQIEEVDIVPINFIWEQITSLSWLHAVIAISFGIVWLLYGWRIFKILVVISFALLGLYLGIIVGGQISGTQANSHGQVWTAVIGLALFAFVSVPLMKWCVCALGAVAGGILTSGLWYAFGLPQVYMWAGAVIGIIAGGMISFIVFKAAVMLFTSLGGGAIMLIGILALWYLYETKMVEPPTMHIHDLVFNEQWFLPVALLIPTVIGIITQNKLIKHSGKWGL
ncbi:MAG: hypothetical protein ACYTFK_06675 [Planctomycetota bacterium]|jgi:hypothetical protein